MIDKIKELEEEFNNFIRRWCGNYVGHLLDSDENDGERFRLKIEDLVISLLQSDIERFDGVLNILKSLPEDDFNNGVISVMSTEISLKRQAIEELKK